MVREMLAAIEADVYAMEAGTYLAAGLVDKGEHDFSLESACCKVFATEALWTVANDALQVAGGTGFMHEYPYERIVRDARVNLIFEGTNQVLRMMLVVRGTKGLAPSSKPARPRFAGVHPKLSAERSEVENAVASLGRRTSQALERHGASLRDAQHEQRRLADMAVALYTAAAVLSRATASLERGGDEAALEREVALARLACRRQLATCARAERECQHDDDALVEAVARGMTGLDGGDAPRAAKPR
jgi:acyl-CoA dehydrogenase family protein 9